MKRLLFLIALPVVLAAQDAPKPADPPRPWTDKASLSFVATGGNAKSETFGFGNEYKYTWTDASFAFNVGGVRVSTTTVNRSASGPDMNNVSLMETETTNLTTETYFASLRYDHTITDGLQWFATAGWDRNRPSGIDSREVVGAGIGYWWVKEDRTKFRTDLGLGYTKIKPVFETPDFQDSFGTWNLGAAFEKKLFDTSLFTSTLTLTDSLKDSRDYLGVWRNALTTNLNKTLALKVGYDMTYKNKPAFVGVDVVQTPVATPPVVIGQVPVQLKKLDTVFTTSLVITF
jgi:putative salt-induced outer membrane protein YdiY